VSGATTNVCWNGKRKRVRAAVFHKMPGLPVRGQQTVKRLTFLLKPSHRHISHHQYRAMSNKREGLPLTQILGDLKFVPQGSHLRRLIERHVKSGKGAGICERDSRAMIPHEGELG
jgi:hypothetical protein